MKIRQKFIVTIGLLLIAAGILFNEWFLAALFSADGVIASSHRIIIWIVDVGLVSAGILLIIFKRSLTKEKVLIITGLLIVLAGVILGEMFIPVVMGTLMSAQNRLLLRIVEIYVIVAGFMVILYRKTIDLKGVLLFAMSSLFCFILFLGFDYYSYYSRMIKMRSGVSEFLAKSPLERLYIEDDKLGWKLRADARATYLSSEKYDVLYETDEKGFRKINNSTGKPRFSIYFFGDSFTFGDGVNNGTTFSSVIKDRYLKKEVNVYNAGVNGYGIVQMFQRFIIIKDQIQPGDLVIFTPIANDIKRNLTDYTMPYFTKFTNIMLVDKFPFFDHGVITSRKMEDNFYNKLKLAAISAPFTGNYFKFVRNKFIPDTTRESQEMIQIIEREIKLKGGRFVLFFLPETKECLHRKYTVDISGFNYIDIMHFFPSEEDELNKIRLSADDGHYNKRGHEIAARAIIETLVKDRIIDERYVIQN
ncbi:MAG: SGNH/GDSL hydrolase family protein [Nitrospirae bacterium]|nr:SGNH/GDSL hydrolase family protein [Nitrospirota bacterium]